MRIGPYETLAELGRGGCGVVFRARGPQGRAVALKVLLKLDDARRARFERERRLLASLGEADGFVPLLDGGESPHGPWLVMPLLEGGTLRQRLRRPLGVDETVVVGRTLARALARAHQRGIVHRDLKPENVLYDRGGRLFVADLGLAKHFDDSAPGASRSVSLSRHGELRGTPGYLAPEQLRDAKSAGPAADVFALGCILYECLAGQAAFQAEGLVELVAELDRCSPKPLASLRRDAPRWLVAAIERALAKDPKDRFADAEALLDALAPPETPAPPAPRRRIHIIGGFFLIAALTLVAAVVVVLHYRSGKLIVPGESVGTVRIGVSTEGDVRAAFGDAATITTDSLDAVRTAPLAVRMFDGHVAAIAITDPRFATRGGTRVGPWRDDPALGTATANSWRSWGASVTEFGHGAIALDEAKDRSTTRIVVGRATPPAPERASWPRTLVPGEAAPGLVLGVARVEAVVAVFGKDGALRDVPAAKGWRALDYTLDPVGGEHPRRGDNEYRPTLFHVKDGLVLSAIVEERFPFGVRTPGRVEVGTTSDRLISEFGEPDVREQEGKLERWSWDALGFAVLVGGDGKVVELESTPRSPPEERRLLPGVGLGKVVVGKSTLADALAAFGRDGTVSRERGKTRVDYRTGIVWFDRRRPTRVVVEGDTVTEIVAGPAASGLSTAAGVRPGAPRQDAIEAYGEPFGSFKDGATEWLYWPGLGLNVHVDGRGRIDEVVVTTALKRG